HKVRWKTNVTGLVHLKNEKSAIRISSTSQYHFLYEPVIALAGHSFDDEYLMDFEDKKFQNVSKEGLKLRKDSKDKVTKESFKEFTKWWKETLSAESVHNVKISSRLANTPYIVVTFMYGWSANKERIMQYRMLSDASKQAYMRGEGALKSRQDIQSSRSFISPYVFIFSPGCYVHGDMLLHTGGLFCTFGAQHFWSATMVIARTLRFEAVGKVALQRRFIQHHLRH
ncbi:endoplasmin, partial [Tanacetum coccineum]